MLCAKIIYKKIPEKTPCQEYLSVKLAFILFFHNKLCLISATFFVIYSRYVELKQWEIFM